MSKAQGKFDFSVHHPFKYTQVCHITCFLEYTTGVTAKFYTNTVCCKQNQICRTNADIKGWHTLLCMSFLRHLLHIHVGIHLQSTVTALYCTVITVDKLRNKTSELTHQLQPQHVG